MSESKQSAIKPPPAQIRRDLLVENATFQSLVGNDPSFLLAKNQAIIFAATDAPVLLTGEIYTGKTRFACAMSNLYSPCGPFINVNCSRLNNEYGEKALFGFHPRMGADSKGFIEEAGEGTLFLRNVEKCPHDIQLALVDAFEEGSIRKIGKTDYTPCRFKLIATTCENFEEAHEQGTIVDELYYLLASCKIEIPALRFRKSDIVPLAQYFVQTFKHYNSSSKAQSIKFSKESLDFLTSYPWPGNIRQLQGAIRHATDLCENSIISLEDFPQNITHLSGDRTQDSFLEENDLCTLEEVERRYINHVLHCVDSNITKAANILGISRNTLYRKISEPPCSPDSSPIEESQ